MSELKYYKLFHRASALTSPNFISVVDFGINAEIYDKSEADKAIEDKDTEIRRLKKALYKACSNWARSERYTEATWHGDEHREGLWAEVEERCRAMADKFKEADK